MIRRAACLLAVALFCGVVSARAQNIFTTGNTSALTSGHVLVGNGTRDIKPDSTCITDVAGAMSCISFKGALICVQGSALGHATANTITTECPAAVTAYEIVKPGAAATGIMHWSNAAGVVTESISAISLTADISGELPLANMRAETKKWSCEIASGDPGAASPVLANDNDALRVCYNATGVTVTISSVLCYSDAGSPTVTPIVTGGSATSILSGALTCNQTGAGASGSLQGTPTLSSGDTVDANITTAGGTAKYMVIRIVGTI